MFGIFENFRSCLKFYFQWQVYGQFGEAMPRTCHEVAFCENACGLPPAFLYVRAQPRCVLHCGVCYPRVTRYLPGDSYTLHVHVTSRTRLRYFASPPWTPSNPPVCVMLIVFLPIVSAFRGFFDLSCNFCSRYFYISQKFHPLINIELSDGSFTICEMDTLESNFRMFCNYILMWRHYINLFPCLLIDTFLI